MLQDIKPFVFNNSYKLSTPKDDDYLAIVKDRSILLKISDDIYFPTLKDIKEKFDVSEYTFLFEISGHGFYKAPAKSEDSLLKLGFEYINQHSLTDARSSDVLWKAYGAVASISLCNWYKNNRFCSKCGKELSPDTKERMLYCKNCGNMVYPRINPVIIAGIINNDKILLTQYAGKTGKKNYALVAGFNEIGESIEDTIHREIFEETGLKIKNIKYYKSQPWPLSDSLLFGFFCELDGPDLITLQQDELGFAGWFKREDIPSQSGRTSLTAEMIQYFKTQPEIK